ncbi:hypothetical protein MTR67_022387 [Solanum verrucosum]|uniref:Uncharacterized protein n=1 Tax=Solanum verrucosum TaxID=315347 RepID=A0AAF0TQH6_SOLVR|nr:hypothetical protein MTR67_022387 [Solanum verrucosum]
MSRLKAASIPLLAWKIDELQRSFAYSEMQRKKQITGGSCNGGQSSGSKTTAKMKVTEIITKEISLAALLFFVIYFFCCYLNELMEAQLVTIAFVEDVHRQ